MSAFTYLPEVLNDNIVLRISAVVGVFLPVVNIDICDTSDEQLQFTLIKHVDQVRRDHLVEPCNECIELLFHPLLDTPFRDEFHVLFLVLVVDLDVATAFLEIDCDLFAKSLVFNGECAVDDICNVVFHGPSKSPVEFGIDTFHVLEVDFLLEYHLVESANEERVEESPVEDGKAYNSSNELEVPKMLRVDTRMWVDLEGVVVVRAVFEQTVKRIEHLMGQQEEELSGIEVSITVFAGM